MAISMLSAELVFSVIVRNEHHMVHSSFEEEESGVPIGPRLCC